MTASADHAPTLIGLGELLWDIFPDRRRPGGAPANVAFHANQLGLRGLVCSRVGSDELGWEICDYLTQRGVDTTTIQQDAEHDTGTVVVHGEGRGPTYEIKENVAWDYLALDDRWTEQCKGASAVCFGTLAQRGETTRRTIAGCLEIAADAWRIYDVNLRPPYYDRQLIEQSLKLCNVVKFNDQELPELAKLLNVGSTEPPMLARYLLAEYPVKLVAITRGPEGAWLMARDEVAEVPSQPVEVADTVGAGDAFTAGLAYGLIHEWPLEATGRLANRVAGLVAGQSGAMPSIREAVQAAIESTRA